MRADGDWLLYAAYNDAEKVRNAFCSDLWMDSCAANNPFGVQNGMEYRYLELFLDGHYWGLYALGYPIDEKQLGIRSDLGGYTEYLFQKLDWSASETTIPPGQPYLDGYELHTLGSAAQQTVAWQTLVGFYRALCADGTSAEQLYTMADLGNAIDLYLFYDLVQGIDNITPGGPLPEAGLKNLFLSFKQRQGQLVALYTPWDMDLTWGNVYSVTSATNTEPYALSPQDSLRMYLNPVSRLQELGDAGINALIRQRYADLRAGAWSEAALLAMLDGFEEDIFASGAFARDAARWPGGDYVPAQQGLSRFKAYVKERLQAMDAEIAALP